MKSSSVLIRDVRFVEPGRRIASGDVLVRHGRIVATGVIAPEAAGGIPVLLRGGGKVGDREILQRTHDLLAQGASGIVYGRNIIQHAKPAAITRALMGLVHDNLSVDQALAIVQK